MCSSIIHHIYLHIFWLARIPACKMHVSVADVMKSQDWSSWPSVSVFLLVIAFYKLIAVTGYHINLFSLMSSVCIYRGFTQLTAAHSTVNLMHANGIFCFFWILVKIKLLKTKDFLIHQSDHFVYLSKVSEMLNQTNCALAGQTNKRLLVPQVFGLLVFVQPPCKFQVTCVAAVQHLHTNSAYYHSFKDR